ncbi:hypothetical protein NW752_009836 [Fusarium irregulare]|uniref:Uncharacterized protein n=1 Tax=Fusarium irregulare TaxID=2494466 RepID=A0A9W8PYT9_9HYPO|nr:hypothetical protein NW752_009836 [Fusarium irregulare]KAJ4020956.1 hypothetical protein NW766_002452 [Fusarium irregulare]
MELGSANGGGNHDPSGYAAMFEGLDDVEAEVGARFEVEGILNCGDFDVALDDLNENIGDSSEMESGSANGGGDHDPSGYAARFEAAIFEGLNDVEAEVGTGVEVEGILNCGDFDVDLDDFDENIGDSSQGRPLYYKEGGY